MNEAEKMPRSCDAFNTSDLKTLTETFGESASWDTPGQSPVAGDAKAHNAVFAQFGRYAGDTGVGPRHLMMLLAKNGKRTGRVF